MFCAVEREGFCPALRPTQSGPEILLPELVAPFSLLDLCLLLLDETSYLCKTGVGLRNSSVREVLAVLVWDLSFILRTHFKKARCGPREMAQTLSVFAALTKDPGSGPLTHMVVYNHL